MVQEASKQHLFDGAWMPSVDPTLIGPRNFSELRNLRPVTNSVEGVLGYTKLNETALSAYPYIRNGHQLRTPSGDQYVFVQAENGSGGSRVYRMDDDAPDGAEFVSQYIHEDGSGAGVGRFAEVAQGQMVYANGVETRIWGGSKGRVAACFAVDDSTDLTNPKDYTEAVNSSLSSAKSVMPLSGSYLHFLVFTTRPIQGLGVSLSAVNSTTSDMTVTYWNGSAMTAVSNLVDGTDTGTIALAQDGDVTFDSTAATAKPMHFQGLYFYAYLFSIDAGSATISHLTVDKPWQAQVDVWDGVFRTPIQFQAERSSEWEDFRLEVNEESSLVYLIAAAIGGLTSSDQIVIMFEDRMAGIRWKVAPTHANAAAVTATVKYWDGDSWVAVSGFNDATLDDSTSTKTLAQTGLMSWDPPNEEAEFAHYAFASTGYAYQITFSGTLTDDTDHSAVSIDLITGVPAPMTVPDYSTCCEYKGMTVLANRQDSNEGNRVDYSMPNAPDVFNGDLSSGLGPQAIYVGGAAAVVGAAKLTNRYGSNIFEILLLLKDGETYILNGDSPEDFKVYSISQTIGCPAPLTLTTTEVGAPMGQGVTRNVAMWLSFSGPVMFDGAVLNPMPGLEKFFDPTETTMCCSWDHISRARGWYDALYGEYNLVIPTAGNEDGDLWVAYSMSKQKWFRKDPAATGALIPQAAIQILDDNGRRHVYGGLDSGHLARLEHGTSWAGKSILQLVETGDFWCSDDIWAQTLIRRIKLYAARIDEEGNVVSVVHIPETIIDGVAYEYDEDLSYFTPHVDSYFSWLVGSALNFDLGLSGSGRTTVRGVAETNLRAQFHRLQFSTKTSSTIKGFRPLAWGVQYREERIDR